MSGRLSCIATLGLVAVVATVLGPAGGGVGLGAHEPSPHGTAASPESSRRAESTRPAVPPTSAPGTLRLIGVVQAKPELVAHVAAPMWGRLDADPKPMTVGQVVRKGEPLVRLVLELSADERYLMQSRKVEIQAAATVARGRHQQADREFRQAVDLLRLSPDDPFRRQQVDATERLLKAAAEEETLYDRQDKSFDTVIQRRDPRITVVEAPIAGVITEVTAKTGERNPTGAFRRLCTITDLSRVWIAAEVYERDLGAAMRATSATFSAADSGVGARNLGMPFTVLPWLDELKRTATMIFEVPNPDRRLALGMTVFITMAVPKPPAPTRPAPRP